MRLDVEPIGLTPDTPSLTAEAKSLTNEAVEAHPLGFNTQR